MKKKRYLITLVCLASIFCLVSYVHINVNSFGSESELSLQNIDESTENLLPETKIIQTLIIKASELIRNTGSL